jgi:RNA polymerase sigma-70 factor (ECF subfamily)
MATINLRNFYPAEKVDCFIEVPDGDAEVFTAVLSKEIADVYFTSQRKENAYRRRAYWNNAQYSLDNNDGIESAAVNESADPFEILSDKLTHEQLWKALNSLPEKQYRRICAHYFLDMSKTDIACSEGVNESKIRAAIKRGLETMKKILDNFQE